MVEKHCDSIENLNCLKQHKEKSTSLIEVKVERDVHENKTEIQVKQPCENNFLSESKQFIANLKNKLKANMVKPCDFDNSTCLSDVETEPAISFKRLKKKMAKNVSQSESNLSTEDMVNVYNIKVEPTDISHNDIDDNNLNMENDLNGMEIEGKKANQESFQEAAVSFVKIEVVESDLDEKRTDNGLNNDFVDPHLQGTTENFEQQKRKCQICNKFVTRLNKHMLTHTGEKPFQCDICKRRFNQPGNLNKHMLLHTGEKPYKCTICQKAFNHPANLNKHMILHTGEKPYQCDICERYFRFKSVLNKHRKTHLSQEKPYKCDICETCFREKANLHRHMFIHTGEKPYECSICNKLFRDDRNLKQHMVTHTGVKQFKCDLCDKSFRQQGHLRIHKLIHTGEKPFKCDKCIKGFYRQNDLKRHSVRHR